MLLVEKGAPEELVKLKQELRREKTEKTQTRTFSNGIGLLLCLLSFSSQITVTKSETCGTIEKITSLYMKANEKAKRVPCHIRREEPNSGNRVDNFGSIDKHLLQIDKVSSSQIHDTTAIEMSELESVSNVRQLLSGGSLHQLPRLISTTHSKKSFST